jgi:quercetin dioxygenase-like cupin family protein
MDTHPAPHAAVFEPDGVSRRDVLIRAGAGGLALALLAQARNAASAQEGTPVPGMPEGVTQEALIPIPIRMEDLPTEPFSLVLARLTLEPGAVIPASSFPFIDIIYVEDGELVCPGEEGRWVYAPDGSVTGSGAGELPIPAGSAIYHAPNSVDGARNDGTVPVVSLVIDFMPDSMMATPTP